MKEEFHEEIRAVSNRLDRSIGIVSEWDHRAASELTADIAELRASKAAMAAEIGAAERRAAAAAAEISELKSTLQKDVTGLATADAHAAEEAAALRARIQGLESGHRSVTRDLAVSCKSLMTANTRDVL